MIAILSPSKTIHFKKAPQYPAGTQPMFLADAERIMVELKKLSPQALARLMKVNDVIAQQTWERTQSWSTPFGPSNSRRAADCFSGAVYTGLDASSWDDKSFEFAQDHLCILSGLYGILKPNDFMQPYRLEMGLKWQPTPAQKNLYAFWGSRIQKHLQEHSDGIIINLASREYSQSAMLEKSNTQVITPDFKEKVGGVLKSKMTYAKEARGRMAKFFIENQCKDPEELKGFKEMGYTFDKNHSSESLWVFSR